MCTWVYRLKEMLDSEGPKYNARIVVKGFQQEYGVDFDKIFTPVRKMRTLRFLLSMVIVKDLQLIQLDVKTTFLHSDIEEEIYMDLRKHFVATDQEHLVC